MRSLPWRSRIAAGQVRSVPRRYFPGEQRAGASDQPRRFRIALLLWDHWLPRRSRLHDRLRLRDLAVRGAIRHRARFNHALRGFKITRQPGSPVALLL